MEAEKSRETGDDILFRYQPEGSFTRTMGWLFATLPLIGVLAGVIDLFSDRSVSVGLITIGLSLAVAGLLYLGSRSIDHMQERIRVEVLSSGVLRFRNLMGRVREIPLRHAQSFEVRICAASRDSSRPRVGVELGGTFSRVTSSSRAARAIAALPTSPRSE